MPATHLAIALGANMPSLAGHPCQTLLAVRPQLETLVGAWAASASGGVSAPVKKAGQDIHCSWSPLLETAPMGGPSEQPTYLNAVVLITGELGDPSSDQALVLLDHLHALEHAFGRRRDREQRWGPRTLDLDVLFWEELRLDHPRLLLPHPRMHLRGFVLQPLLAAMQASVDW